MRETFDAYSINDRAGSDRRTGKLHVESDNVFDPGRGLYVAVRADRDGMRSVWLSEADSRTLATKLANRYGVAPLAEIKDGDEVAILPDARGGAGEFNFHGATRFKVTASEPDGDGDVVVERLDGERPGSTDWVLPAYLRSASAILLRSEAPAEPAKPVFAPGLAVALTEMHAGIPTSTHGLVQRVSGDDVVVVLALRGTLPTRRIPAAKLALLTPDASAEAKPFTLTDGAVVALLPGAEDSSGGQVFLKGDTTRVKVLRSTPDGDGEVLVEALNGEEQGIERYLLPSFLAPLSGPWAVGDEAVVTRSRPYAAALFEGDRVRIAGFEADGRDIRVSLVSGRGEAGTPWYVREDSIRRP